MAVNIRNMQELCFHAKVPPPSETKAVPLTVVPAKMSGANAQHCKAYDTCVMRLPLCLRGCLRPRGYPLTKQPRHLLPKILWSSMMRRLLGQSLRWHPPEQVQSKRNQLVPVD